MKIFISSDIEGISGSTIWDETIKNGDLYNEFAHQMTLETKAACDGANIAGAEEIMVKDAHDSGRNIEHRLLPKNVKLIRGWSGGPFSMVQELDYTYDALIFIGYHSSATKDTNPLSHTMTTILDYVKINGEIASEFLIHSYIAAYVGVPIAFLSGDKGLCEDVKKINPNIVTVAVKEGRGNSTINIHPELAVELIQEGVKESLKADLSKCGVKLPEFFEVEIRYREHKDAYANSHYPNVIKMDENSIKYCHHDYLEVLRMMKFLI
ncbi:MAG: amino acid amidase [Tissierellia bacterium]|jgi:D-amino peptidase|nr:amino acid amidase [Tissierellia bacterium]